MTAPVIPLQRSLVPVVPDTRKDDQKLLAGLCTRLAIEWSSDEGKYLCYSIMRPFDLNVAMHLFRKFNIPAEYFESEVEGHIIRIHDRDIQANPYVKSFMETLKKNRQTKIDQMWIVDRAFEVMREIKSKLQTSKTPLQRLGK